MNQNHWNDSNDQNQNDRTEHITPSDENRYDKQLPTRGISSFSYETGGKTSPKARRVSGSRVAVIVAVAMLCLAMCSCSSVAGSFVAGLGNDYAWGGEPSNAADGNGETNAPGFGTSATDGDVETPVHSADDTNRNLLPEMNKQPSLGSVTYTGSAGDAAYDTLAEAYANVADTVVEISTETVVNGGFFGNYVSSGAGSGVIISADGYIVTNHHVIDGADSITVTLKNGTAYEALLIGTDESSDIAVLWVDAKETLAAAELGCSADLIVGEEVFAIGNPLGSLGGTLTDGIISATARELIVGNSKMTLLQTNAAVNPGNSGGGLFNMAGQLIGVVNAKSSEDNVEGLGFAIPVDTAYDVICQLIEYGYVRGVVDSGLTLYDVSNTMTAWKNFGSTRLGAYIVESEYSDELQYGDYLLNIDGVSVTSGADAERVLSGYEVGDTVTLTVVRLVEEVQNGKRVVMEKTWAVALTLREYIPADVNVRFDAE